MKNIIKKLCTIIATCNLFQFTTVKCNRYFQQLPPYPYYQDDQYYIPNFTPGHPVPIFYNEHTVPFSVPYGGYYSSASHLFQQNNNYHNPGIVNQKQSFNTLAIPTLKSPVLFPKIDKFKILIKTVSPSEQSDSPIPPNLHIQNNNISPKEGNPQQYYLENYHDEDYSDNYNDEGSALSEPCGINSPYQYFQADPNNPNIKIPLCNPHGQPQVINEIHGLRAPITLLPSQFPPRIEQIIEKIQTYFSTYVEKETKKPQNQTKPTSTTQTVTQVPVDDCNKSNCTEKTTEPELQVTTSSYNTEITKTTETLHTENETIEKNVSLPDANKNNEEYQVNINLQSEAIPKEVPNVIQSETKSLAENTSVTETVEFIEKTSSEKGFDKSDENNKIAQTEKTPNDIKSENTENMKGIDTTESVEEIPKEEQISTQYEKLTTEQTAN